MLDNIINDCCKFTPSYYKSVSKITRVRINGNANYYEKKYAIWKHLR